jgi:hypothetical protein
MPKKNVIIRNVALGNSTQQLPNSISKLRGDNNKYGLRAANERTSSRRDKDFIYDVDKLPSTAQKVQVKTDGDSLRFISHAANEEEELEGGILETAATKQSPVKSFHNNGLPLVDANKASTNNFHAKDGSEKASAGTTAFVQILLHTLSCSLSCQQPSCRKMGMVLKHYKTCQEKRRKEAIEKLRNNVVGDSKEAEDGVKTSPNCSLCQQFAKIVAQHSMYLCNLSPQETGCPVPMCDTMRKIRDSRKNLTPVPMQT